MPKGKKPSVPRRSDIHDVAHLPLVAFLPPHQQKRMGGKTIVIPNPRDVERLVFSIPKGSIATQRQICASLAAKSGADLACPQITGLFIRFVAARAEEQSSAGKKRVAPYWRVVGPDGVLNDHFPGGSISQARKLMEEGLAIVGSGMRRAPQVDEYRKFLAKI